MGSAVNVQADVVSGEDQLCHTECPLTVTWHDGRGEGAQWGLSALTSLSPSQASCQNAITPGIKFATYEFWQGHRHSIYGNRLLLLPLGNISWTHLQLRAFALAVHSAWDTQVFTWWNCSWHSNLLSDIIFLKTSSPTKQALSPV